MKRERKEAANKPPPNEEEARRLLRLLKNSRLHTKEYFESILNNDGIGIFQPDKGRTFNRNLLFNRSEIAPILNIYTPSLLSEIRRCHMSLWAAADDDPDMEDLNSFIQTFKHEWEDFFQALAARFPDEAAELISDFEYCGIEMFCNLESAIISEGSKTSDAESDIGLFEAYLPEVKKLFVKENKNSAKNLSSTAQVPSREKWETAEALINHLCEIDKKKEQEHLRLLRKSFSDNWLFSEATLMNNDKRDAQPEFSLLIDTIQSAIVDVSNGHIRAPGAFGTWQLILPLALTYPTDLYDYAELVENDDDPQTFSEVLSSGERVFIRAYNERHPLESKVDRVQKLTGSYLETALKLSQKNHSKSEDLWAEALGNFKRVNHAFRLSRNQNLIDAMAQKMVDAASRLAIDLELNDEPATTVQSESLAEDVAAKIREQQLNVRVVELESLSPNALEQIKVSVNGLGNKRENVIAFIRTLYKNRNECGLWKSTVGYVRNLTDETNPDYPKCAAVQAYIKSVAKKEVGGIDKAWNSLAQEVKLSHGKKKKSEDLGPVPILDKGSDFL